MEIGKFNQMKAYLLKPKRLFTNKQNTIGGGTIQGEDLGSRSGFADPITNKEFKKLYTKFQKDKKNIGTDAEFADILNKKYVNQKGNKFKASNIYKKRKDLGIKTAVKSGEPAPAVMQQFNKVTEYLQDLIPKLNKEEKFYTQEQVSSMVEKKFNIEPRYKTVDGKKYKVNRFGIDKYPIMKNLDSVETKLENTLKNMLLEDKPLNDFWYDALGKRVGLDYRTINSYLPRLQTYEVIKDQGATSLKNRFNKKATHSFLKNKSFKDQLTTALEMEKGLPVFTGEAGEAISSPKTKVMDFAKRNWNANRGEGDVVFYKKGSNKPITWDFGVTLPYNDVYFKYKGNKYSAKTLSDIDLVKKDFPEVYENQRVINNLKRYEIVDPLNKNKKISVGKLIERNQIDNYQWKPTGTLDILHGANGVKNEPFTNLNFSSRDINTLQRNIDVTTAIPDDQKIKINDLLNKVAAGDTLNIVARQANIARKGAGFDTMFSGIIDEIQNTGTVSKKKLSEIINVYEGEKKKLGKELNFYCNIGKTRVNTATGMVPGATCSSADIERGMRADAKTPEGRERLTKVAKNFGKVFGKIVAPIDIGIEGAFALPHLLRGDAEGAIAATTAGLFGAGKDAMEQVGERFGTDSPEYALYGAENAIQQKMTAIAGLDKLLMQNRQLGVIPEESGEFKKGIGRQPQEDALRKQFAEQFVTLSKLDKGATEDFAQYYPLTADLTQRNKAIQNVRGLSDEIQSSGLLKNIKGPSDPKTIEGFLETAGGRSKFPILPRFDLPALRAQATDYTGMDYLDRVSDMPTDIAAQVPAFEKSQIGQGVKDYAMKFGPMAAKEFFEAQGIDTQPFLEGMQPLLYKANGGRIGFKKGFGIFKGLPGIQLGRIEKELIKKYKREDAERSLIDIIKQSNEEANQIVNKRKLDYINDLMKDTNILDEKYVNLIDEEIRINDPELFKTIKQFEANERPALADKMRALRHPDWAEANYGEDYMSALEQGQVREINKMMDDLPDVQERTLVDDIDDMNKANIDEIMGRKKNAIGGRITFASGGRMSYAEGPEDPSKRKFLKNVGIGGGIAGGIMTGLVNLMDLFKGGKKGVVATKAAESQAEKIFFDLVNTVKDKGILRRLDDPSELKQGEIYEYKGVKVLEDGENIEVRFETDKGAPAMVEYRKPGYEVDPDAGTSVQVPGEFIGEGQEVYRIGGDNYYKDIEEEIIDPIENIKKIASE